MLLGVVIARSSIQAGARMQFIENLWNWIRQVLGLIVPILAEGKDFGSRGPAFRWVLRILLIAALFGLAYLLQWWWPLERILYRVPQNSWGYALQYHLWAVALVAALLVTIWNACWLWKLLMEEDDYVEFPDIERAWRAATEALEHEKVPLGETPLYLVLGQPAGGEEPFFKASRMDWRVRQVPPGKEKAPLRIWAKPDAIILTCAGASLLGRLAGLLAEESTSPALPERTAAPQADIRGTIMGAGVRDIASGPESRSIAGAGAPGTIAKDGGGDVRGTISGADVRRSLAGNIFGTVGRWVRQTIGGGRGAEAPLGSPVQAFIKNHAERERMTARLRYLCRLVARDTKPHCPLQGVLFLAPAPLLDGPFVGDGAALCRQDLASIRSALQLQFPTLVLVTDMEKLAGYGEFIKAFPGNMRTARVGQGIPWVADLEHMRIDYPTLLQKAATQICRFLVPSWVYKTLRLDPKEGAPSRESLAHNVQLFRFMHQMHDREEGMARILQTLIPQGEAAALCAGCYLAGTGSEAKEQAFIPGALDKLTTSDMMKLAGWRPQALAQDEKYRRLTILGYVATGILTVIVLGVLFVIGSRSDAGDAANERPPAGKQGS